MALFIILNNSSLLLNKLANFCLVTAFTVFYSERYVIKSRYHHTIKNAKNELVNNLKIITDEEFAHTEIILNRQMKKELNNQINDIIQLLENKINSRFKYDQKF